MMGDIVNKWPKMLYKNMLENRDKWVENEIEYDNLLYYRDEDNNSLLHIAACSGNANIVRYCVKRGVDVNQVNQYGESALFFTLKNYQEKRSQKTVGALLEFGADVKLTRFNKQSALHFAVATDNPDIIVMLLERGIEVNALDASGHTALYNAVNKGCRKAAQCLLEHGAEPDVCQPGDSPLVCAIMNSDADLARLLWSHGARNLEFEGPKGLHLMQYMVWMRDIGLTRDLLSSGGLDIHAADEDGFTALHEAAIAADADLVEHLIDMGADLHARTVQGNTALHWAALRLTEGHAEYERVMELLLARGSQPNERNHDGTTVLHFVVKNGGPQDVLRMVAHGAKPLNENHYGETMLHWAAVNPHREVVQLLLDFGVPVNECCIYGLTALHIAARTNRTSCIKLLVKHGADLGARDVNGRTALYFAAKAGHVHAVETLLGLGAEVNRLGHADSSLLVQILENREVFKPEMGRFFLRHLTMREAAGEPISPKNLEAIQKRFPKYYRNCKLELEVMKSVKVMGGLSAIDLLLASKTKWLSCARNPHLLDKVTKIIKRDDLGFNTFSPKLASKMREAKRRLAFVKAASHMLSSVLPIRDPDHLVIGKIVEFISSDELPYL